MVWSPMSLPDSSRFLAELPEFGQHGLEVLRQPLEDGVITIRLPADATKQPTPGVAYAALRRACMLVAGAVKSMAGGGTRP